MSSNVIIMYFAYHIVVHQRKSVNKGISGFQIQRVMTELVLPLNHNEYSTLLDFGILSTYLKSEGEGVGIAKQISVSLPGSVHELYHRWQA